MKNNADDCKCIDHSEKSCMTNPPPEPCACKIIEIRPSARFRDGLAKIDYCPLHANAGAILNALKEILKGQGAFSLDHKQHAINTIENMKDIAREAIQAAEGKQENL